MLKGYRLEEKCIRNNITKRRDKRKENVFVPAKTLVNSKVS